MNRSQLSQIVLTRRVTSPRRGMTMVEVMVAMAILLVGIWAVASGFPKLFGTLAHEEKRTEMSRLVEAAVGQFNTGSSAVPLAITGDPLDPIAAAGIHPDSVPDDPDIALGPPNSRDDILWVEGESFVVSTTQAHVLSLGLAPEWALAAGEAPLVAVYEVREAIEGTNFDVNYDNGAVNTTYDFIEISYAWQDDTDLPPGMVHYVHREVVEDGGTLTPIVGSHQTVVQASVHAIGRINFPPVVYDPPGPPYLDPDIEAAPVLDSGAVLLFAAEDVGRPVRVDYYLRTATDPRSGLRDLIMVEDRQITSAVGQISLVGTGIDTAQPLFGPNTYIIAVDLNTGQVYQQGVGFDFAQVVDYGRGLLTLNFLNPEDVLGHTLRFYYRTTDQDTITVQKAPSVFVENWAMRPGDEYRSYLRDDTANPPLTLLAFPPCAAGQTVAVDYTYGPTPSAAEYVVGEMHTINPGDYTITLNNPNVQSIIAVRGMSLKVRAWWRTQTGRLVHYDVDTIF